MSEDETLSNPDEEGFEEFLAPVVFQPSKRKTQKMLLPDGTSHRVPELKLPQAAPMFHDTSEEAHIDDDLAQLTANINLKIGLLPSARTIDEALRISREVENSIIKRRTLANKQLGAEKQVEAKTFYRPIPD